MQRIESILIAAPPLRDTSSIPKGLPTATTPFASENAWQVAWLEPSISTISTELAMLKEAANGEPSAGTSICLAESSAELI